MTRTPAKPIVDIGIACGPVQVPAWWSSVMALLLEEDRIGEAQIGHIRAVGSALPDHNMNHTLGGPIDWSEYEKRRASLTDANQVTVADGFLKGNAEWLFWIEDDTIPPAMALTTLLKVQRDAVGGLYYNPRKKLASPIAFLKADEGYYYPLAEWPHGALMPVDSIGFGCTLVHRSVFERIAAGHVVFERPDRTLYPVPKERVLPDMAWYIGDGRPKEDIYVQDGYFHMRAKVAEMSDRPWPFFAMEYGRTQDHYFWELAANVGIKPWLDTSINCGHAKIQVFTREDYLELKRKGEAA